MASVMNLGLGEYPIVLSDALLGRATSELYTGINYSQNTAIDSNSSRSRRLAPSGEKANNFSLSFPDTSDNLSFEGERSSAQDQYILIFDADKEQYVLHRVDSNFDMKRVNSSGTKNISGARSHPSQPESRAKLQIAALPKNILKKSPATAVESHQGKAENIKEASRSEIAPETDEAEDDSDDGLIIEISGAQSPVHRQHQSSQLHQRQLSEEVSDDEGDLAQVGHEEPEQIVEVSGHVSPVSNTFVEMSDEDMELALEAELEQELMKDYAEQVAEESDESEEE